MTNLADMTMDVNHWVVEDPAWVGYSKNIATSDHFWTEYYGDDSYIRSQKPYTGRFPISWPNIAEHFYTVKQIRAGRVDDVIFASYRLDEIKRFIQKLGWVDIDARIKIYDEVTEEYLDVKDFLE